MSYPVCGTVPIKDPLLLMGKSSLGSRGSRVVLYHMSDAI